MYEKYHCRILLDDSHIFNKTLAQMIREKTKHLREWLLMYHDLLPHSAAKALLVDTQGVIPINVYFAPIQAADPPGQPPTTNTQAADPPGQQPLRTLASPQDGGA